MLIDEFKQLRNYVGNDKAIRIITNLPNWSLICDKTDVIRYEDNYIVIVRANGNVTVVNFDYVVSFNSINKNSILR